MRIPEWEELSDLVSAIKKAKLKSYRGDAGLDLFKPSLATRSIMRRGL
jgi:hypothetical protein